MTEPRNLSARMAHWSAQHKKIAIFGWLAFCFVAFAFGTMALGVTSLDASNAGVRESGRMDRLLDRDFKTPAGERVIIQSQTLTANDPRFAVVVADVLRRLKANETTTNFTTPVQDTGLISADKHSAVIATMGLLAIPSMAFPMDDSIGAVVLLIGLAVGVDYTMFYLKREREERREGKSPEEALQIAAATSGRSVLISGITVMIAMAGMFLTGDPTFQGFGAATILVVAVAVIGSLT